MWLRRLLGRLRHRMPLSERVRWFGTASERAAAGALAEWAVARRARDGGRALVVGDGGTLEQRLCARLRRRGVPYRTASLESAPALPQDEAEAIGIVLCAFPDARRQTRAAIALAAHPVLGLRPFEHVAGLDPAHATFRALDEYADTDFVSPVLLDDPTPYEIYRESLRHFRQKCGLRDYLDLYQLLRSAVVENVPGDIAEFGSYRGHSGWLIARSLEALGSDKRVWLFDTFESFPQEAYGVDHFWSATHAVDFEAVRAKFADRPGVTLVKGDFTETLSASGMGPLALAYIDCDSYRATRFLLQTLPGTHLSARGVLVCEDYGHPALLGNRAAVHEILESTSGWFKFFSQFSGLYVMVKLDSE